MSINQHQFEQLTEMGISLWQQRTYDGLNKTNQEKTQSSIKHYLNISLKVLAEQQLFTDILLSTGLSIGEVHQKDDHLDLGLFNWYFVASTKHSDTNNSLEVKHEVKQTIQWFEHQLVTPSITEISKSPALKKQLWQLLSIKTQ